MGTEAYLAITNGQLQIDDFIWLGILTFVMAAMASYVHKLTRDLHRTKQLLEDQAKFNAKLNDTVERVLGLDRDGQIDSHRRPQKHKR